MMSYIGPTQPADLAATGKNKMNSNRFRSNRPTPLTNADRARMRAAIEAHDRRQATARAWRRLHRLAAACIGAGLAVALFYSATN